MENEVSDSQKSQLNIERNANKNSLSEKIQQ
jgi:hypothetical protein